jgi:hypothetical protein
MKISAILSGYSQDLNDAQAITWPTSQLLSWYQEGVALLATAVPEKAYKRVIVPIQPCQEVTEVCACENIHSVIGLCDEYGRVTKRLREVSFDEATALPPKRYTGPTTAYAPDSYAVDRRLNMVQVFKAPPPNYVGYLLLECLPKQSAPLSFDSETDLSNTELAIVRQWVLWSARMVDDLDATANTSAAAHKAMFEQLLGLYAKSTQAQMVKE